CGRRGASEVSTQPHSQVQAGRGKEVRALNLDLRCSRRGKAMSGAQPQSSAAGAAKEVRAVNLILRCGRRGKGWPGAL
ncbi:hypothetical protein CYMTET_49664, partial [Cymbomonas tetramitiformis]